MTDASSIELRGEAATAAFGRALAPSLAQAAIGLDHALTVFLQGDLGAGKTALCRALIVALGYQGLVKSPTYTLVEPYQGLSGLKIYHFDLYRLSSPEELEFLGARDYFATTPAICLLEWPDKGEGALPSPDLIVTISGHGDARTLRLHTNSAPLQQRLASLCASFAG